ncbi:cag pathogenicity island Cag12 family protein [Proteus mirabilis]
MKKGLWFSIFILVGCSSPPKAPSVDWDKKETMMNENIMIWNPSKEVLINNEANGQWEKVIYPFIAENRLYDDTTFYAIAYANRIIVKTKSGEDFIRAKQWLKQNGAKALIEFQPLKECFMCQTTIYLKRG